MIVKVMNVDYATSVTTPKDSAWKPCGNIFVEERPNPGSDKQIRTGSCVAAILSTASRELDCLDQVLV
jgi:hypothetical protein